MENNQRDPQLWEMAQKRAAFKRNLFSYAIVIPFLWVLWIIQASKNDFNQFPWPVWPMLGWGIGLAFHWYSAYRPNRANMEEKEYEKLKQSGGK
jgi:hypothetical protein